MTFAINQVGTHFFYLSNVRILKVRVGEPKKKGYITIRFFIIIPIKFDLYLKKYLVKYKEEEEEERSKIDFHTLQQYCTLPDDLNSKNRFRFYFQLNIYMRYNS